MGAGVQPVPSDSLEDALRARLDALRARRGQPPKTPPLNASDQEVNLDLRLRELRRQRSLTDYQQGQALRGARENLARPVAADVTATDRSKFPPAPTPSAAIRGTTAEEMRMGEVTDRLEREAAKRGRLRAVSPGAAPAAFVERAVGRALSHVPGAIGEYGERTASLGEEHQREETLGRETLPWVATLPADIGNLWLELEAGGRIPGPIGRVIGEGYAQPIRATVEGELSAPGLAATVGRVLRSGGREAARFGTLEGVKGAVEQAPPEQVFENVVRGLQSGAAWGAGTQALREGVARLLSVGIKAGRIGVERRTGRPPRYFWVGKQWEPPEVVEALSGTKPGSPYGEGQEIHTPPAPKPATSVEAAAEAPLPEPLRAGGMQQLEEEMVAGKYTPVQLKQLRARLFAGQADLTPEKQKLALRVVDSIDHYLQSKGVAGAAPIEPERAPAEAATPGEALHDAEGKPIPGTEVTPEQQARTVEQRQGARRRGTRAEHPVDREMRRGDRRLEGFAGTGPESMNAEEKAGVRILGREAVPESARLPDGRPVRVPAPGVVVRVPTKSIRADPARFQFKSLGEEGVGPELKGVTKYNPTLAGVLTLWRDPANGQDYVINGHHRLEFATRVGHPEQNVQYIDAPDAQHARAEGALINIAEGRGTAIDVGKFMRDVEHPEEVLKLKGVSLRGELARNGLALSKLEPDVFTQVATGKVPENWGVAIGAELPDAPELQRTALKLARESKARLSLAEVRELAKQVRAAGTEGVTQETLFGSEKGAAALFVPRAQLSAALQKNLAADKRLFSYVSKGARPEELGRAGSTQIDVEAAKGLAEGSAKLEELFTRLSTRKGPLAEVLSAGARRVAHGEAVGAVARELYPAVRRAIEEDLGRPVAPHGPERPAAQVEGSVASQAAAEAEQPPPVETSKDVNQNRLLEPRQIIADAAKQIVEAVTKAIQPKAEPATGQPATLRYDALKGTPEERAREHAITTFGSVAESKRAAKRVVQSAGRAAQTDLFEGRPAPLDAAAREAAVARAAMPHAWVPIKGQSPKTPAELHGLLWPFRSPSMERMHFLLLDADGRVIEHQMYTSGAINTVVMQNDFVDTLIADMERAGAVETILGHNHPSGNPEPSTDDINFTAYVGRRLAERNLKLRGHFVIDDVTGNWIQHHGDSYSLHSVKLSPESGALDWTATHGPSVVPTGKPNPLTGLPTIQPQDMAQLVLATSGVPDERLDVLYFNTQVTAVALEVHHIDAARDARRWLPVRLKALGADFAVAVVGGPDAGYQRAVMGFRAAGQGVMDVFHVTKPEGQAHPRWVSAAATGLIQLDTGAGPDVYAHRVFERPKGSGANLPAKRPAEAVSPKNRSTFKGKPFWSGVVDLRDGAIERTFTYEQAAAWDFHHNFLLDEASLAGIKAGEKAYFWIDDRGQIRTMDPVNNEFTVPAKWQEVRAKIRAQITGPTAVAEPHRPYSPAEFQRGDKIISPATLMGGRVHRGLHHGDSFDRAERLTQRRLKTKRQASIAHTPEQMQDDLDGLDGFIVRRANGKEQFVDRATALKIAYLNGQLAEGPGPKVETIEDYPHEGELISESLDPSDYEDPDEPRVSEERPMPETIQAVAVRLPDGTEIRGKPGQIHAELIPDVDLDEGPVGLERLWVTSTGRLVDDREAQVIARARGQTNRPESKTLHSSSLREPRVEEKKADYLSGPKLSVLHNLTPENLIAADKMGGFPAPSLAILPEDVGLEGYGGITLIGKAELGDPTKIPVYDADAYTGRNPPPEYPKVRSKTAQRFVDALKPAAKEFDEMGLLVGEVWNELVNRKTGPRPAELERLLARSNTVRALYVREQGVTVKPKMQAVPLYNDLSRSAELREFFKTHGVDHNARPGDPWWAAFSQALDRAIPIAARATAAKYKDSAEVAAIFRTQVRERFFGPREEGNEALFGVASHLIDDQEHIGKRRVDRSATEDVLKKATPDEDAYRAWVQRRIAPLLGTPTVRLQGRKVPYTLENVAAATPRGRGSEGGMTFGPGAARAAATQRITDLAWLRNAIKAPWGVRPKAEVEAARKKIEQMQKDWREAMTEYYRPDAFAGGAFGQAWEGLDAVHRALGRWARPGRARSSGNLRRELTREGFSDVPAELLEDGVEVGKAIMSVAVPYFEGKPPRAVAFDEFAGAVIPDNAPPEVREILQRRRIPHRAYSGSVGDSEERRTEVVRQFRRDLHDAGFNTLFEPRQRYGGEHLLPSGPEGATRLDLAMESKDSLDRLLRLVDDWLRMEQSPDMRGIAQRDRDAIVAELASRGPGRGVREDRRDYPVPLTMQDIVEKAKVAGRVDPATLTDEQALFLVHGDAFLPAEDEPVAVKRWDGQVFSGANLEEAMERAVGGTIKAWKYVGHHEIVGWGTMARRGRVPASMEKGYQTIFGDFVSDAERIQAVAGARAKLSHRVSDGAPLYQPNLIGTEQTDPAIAGELRRAVRLYEKELPNETGEGLRATVATIRATVERFKARGVTPDNPDLLFLANLADRTGIPRPAPATGPEQPSMFGAKAGTVASRSLVQTEAQARADIARLRQAVAATRDDGVRNRLMREIAQLEKLVNRDKALTSEELARQAAGAEPPEEIAPVDPTQGTLFEHGPQYEMLPQDGSDKLDDKAEEGGPVIPEPSIRDTIRRLFDPAGRTPESGEMAHIIRARAAEFARENERSREALIQYRKQVKKLSKDDRLAFIDAIETGGRQPNAKLQPLADALRSALDRKRKDVQDLGTGKLEHFIENYFPHLWENPEKARSIVDRILGKRPLQGPKSFLKQRTIPTTKEGIAAGLEPVTDDPIDLVLLKLREMNRYLMAQRILKDAKNSGLLQFVRAGKAAERGWRRIDDAVAKVYGPPTEEGAMTIRGEYYGPEPVALVLNNYLSPGLRGNPIFDAYMYLGNSLNAVQLGLSAFHLGFVSMDAITSQVALSLEQGVQGVRTFRPAMVGRAAGTFATQWTAPFTTFVRGHDVIREYLKPGSVGGDLGAIVDALTAGGGRVRMDQFYKNNAVEAFLKAVRQRPGKTALRGLAGGLVGGVLGGPLGAAVGAGLMTRLLPAAMELAAKPLMEYFVPRMKLGVFADLARFELSRLPPDASVEQVRAVMAKVWDSVDNRMGQLVYDNLFWARTQKDLGMASVRALGWNLGTFREVGGGAADVLRGKPSHKAFYILALPIAIGLLGAMMMYLFTGDGPESLQDYFEPRTGKKDADGNDERVQLPSYMKDVIAFRRHPVQTVEHKMHPLLDGMASMLSNADYWGGQIRNPNDPAVEQLRQVADYIATQFTPIGIRNVQEQQRRLQHGVRAALPFVGVTPASREAVRSDAQNLMADFLKSSAPSSATPEEAQQRRARADIADRFRARELTYGDARTALITAGLRGEQVADALRRMMGNSLVERFKQLNLEQAQQVYAIGTPEERSLLGPALFRKIAEAHPRNAPRAPRAPTRR